MKQIQLFTFILACVLLASCEERTGYYDSEQQEIIAKLTANEWRLVYEHTPNFEPNVFQEEGWIYKFNTNGTGSYKWVKWEDGSISGEPVYFRWTFTTDNFSVIYIDKSERFWLIDKLTLSDLWVTSAMQDPILYPNTDKNICKLEAIRQ